MATIYCRVGVEFEVGDELAQDYEQMFRWAIDEVRVSVDDANHLEYWVDDIEIELDGEGQ